LGDFYFGDSAPSRSSTPSAKKAKKAKKGVGATLQDTGRALDSITRTVNSFKGIDNAVAVNPTSWSSWVAGLTIAAATVSAVMNRAKDWAPYLSQKAKQAHELKLHNAQQLDLREAERMRLDVVRLARSADGESVDLRGNMTGYKCLPQRDTGRRICTRKSDGKVFKELPRSDWK